MDGNRFHGRAVCGGLRRGVNQAEYPMMGEQACAVARVTRGGVDESLCLVPRSFQVGIVLACEQLHCNHPPQCHQGRYFDFSIQPVHKGVLSQFAQAFR